MRPRLDRACHPGLLVPLVAQAGACSVDETPPTIIDARFEDENTLVVQFSEPIGPTADIDAARHFRISSGFYVESLGVTAYYDIAHHFPQGVPGVDEDGNGEGLAESLFRHGFTLVAEIERGASDDELRLLLSYPIEPYVCEVLPKAEALGIPAGIFLHYDPGSAPRVADLAGNELGENGGWWVGSTFGTTLMGEFPELDPRMPIPCPEF